MKPPSDRARLLLDRYRSLSTLGAEEKLRLGDVVRERVRRGDLPRFDVPASLVVMHRASLVQRIWSSALGKVGVGLVMVGASSAVIYELRNAPSHTELQAPASTVAHLPPVPRAALIDAPTAASEPKPPMPLDQAAPSAIPPRPRPDRTVAAPSASEPTIDEEVKLMNAAQGALRAGEPKRALELLNEHAARFPAGKLSTARQVTHMMALCQAGKVEQARHEATSFLTKNPSSPFAARVSGICASPKF